MIDGNSLPNGEEDDYINYLLNGCAIVDIWDADSLLHLGKLYIPLKVSYPVKLNFRQEKKSFFERAKSIVDVIFSRNTAFCETLE